MTVYARAMYDFDGAQDGDLPFQEDDCIEIVSKDESGWWRGKTQDGKKGDFPYNYVELISEEEATILLSGGGGGGRSYAPEFTGDRVVSVKIGGMERKSDGTLVFKINATTKANKKCSALKTLANFRELDDQLRNFIAAFDASLPPSWADEMHLNEEMRQKRKYALEHYMGRMMGTTSVDFLLMAWLFPGEKIEMTTIPNDPTAGRRHRGEHKLKDGQLPIMARVMYNWEPKDEVELKLSKGEYIAVLEQKAGSPGWWDGQTAEGERGLFPYNHVRLVEPSEARKLLMGQGSSSKRSSMKRSSVKRMSDRFRGSMSNMSPKASNKTITKKPSTKRPKKAIQEYQIGTLKAFDDMIDNGWALENEAGTGPAAKAGGAVPSKGDRVVMEYTGYTWNCQTQQAVEFSSSDNSPEGALDFVVGSGDAVKGVSEAAKRMEKGMSVRLICTPDYGYGVVGAPPDVPSNTHLLYDLTLVSFAPKGGGGGSSTIGSKAPSVRPRGNEPALLSSKSRHGGQDTGSAILRPVQSRNLAHKRTDGGGGGFGDGKRRVQISKNIDDKVARPESKKKTFKLADLQRYVANQQLDKHKIDAASIEDHLSDKEFKEIFGMDRGTFLLKPGWRQKALKRTAGLF